SGDFALQYQPGVAVAGGEEAQFQVLLRLRDGEGRLRSAGEFVPAAESAGLMPEIDRWVLEQAIPLLQRRRDDGRPVRLFVSQSPHTLARDVHATWLQEMLAGHAIDGPSLVIDLRLDDALVHSVTLRQFADQLMPAGVQFCLSQYVQGADAERLLQQLPLGYLRLSGCYARAHADAALRDELRGIIDHAHRQGLQVIGPQVEDPQGAATLWMSGIDFIQGNLVQQAAGELDFDFQHSVL
ncbi:MAG: EAL domain-containing protein, partial [Lysobacter sp.]|nr:EAL domain-containing protein [Lysobacter sp.]